MVVRHGRVAHLAGWRGSRVAVLTLTLAAACAGGCTRPDDVSSGDAGRDDAPSPRDAGGSVQLPEGGGVSQDGGVSQQDGDALTPMDGAAYAWKLPPGFPEPKVPEDNPMSEAKVELGRHLFYDPRLSENGTQSCASCHQQERAFTDGRPVGIGSTGEAHTRSAMSLANVAYTTTLTWANPALTSLERQALVPLFGEDPVELGFVGKEDELLAQLASDAVYQDLFAKAFPDEEEAIQLHTLTKAIASFERALISGGSAYDRYGSSEPEAMSDSALRGMDLFFGEEAECFHCHGGFVFSDSETHAGKVFDEVAFHNTGLYNLDGLGAYPEGNEGLMLSTEAARDMGRFKAPSLRNVAVTAPYMHDGSIATLQGVIEHYAAGGRTLEDGPNAGVGRQSPLKSELVNGFDFTEAQKADLVAFLESLTDEAFLEDARLADPWKN